MTIAWIFNIDEEGVLAYRSSGVAKVWLPRAAGEKNGDLLNRAHSIADKMEQAITESAALRDQVEVIGPRMLREKE